MVVTRLESQPQTLQVEQHSEAVARLSVCPRGLMVNLIDGQAVFYSHDEHRYLRLERLNLRGLSDAQFSPGLGAEATLMGVQQDG